jgi:hypothetical protein
MIVPNYLSFLIGSSKFLHLPHRKHCECYGESDGAQTCELRLCRNHAMSGASASLAYKSDGALCYALRASFASCFGGWAFLLS